MHKKRGLNKVHTEQLDPDRDIPIPQGRANYGRQFNKSYPTVVLEDSPIIYLRLGDTSGTTATDTSGNARTGTYTGGYTLNQVGPLRDGSKATKFDGVAGTYITIPHAAYQLLTTGFTLECWAQPISVGGGGGGRLFDKADNTAGSNGFMFANVSSNRLDLIVNSAADALTASNALPFGGWHHVVVTVGLSGVVNIFVDGVLNTVGATNTTSGITTTTALLIGGRTAGQTWDGYLAECAIYNYALPLDRIVAHYNARTYTSPFTHGA